MAVTLQGRISLDWSSVNRAMRGTQLAMRSFVSVTGRGLYEAGRNLARFSMIWGAVAAGAAGWALKQSGSFELLRLRLATAVGDTAKAKRAWDETVRYFIASPLELSPLLEARIMLSNFGLTGTRALRAVGNAAIMTGRQVQDVASAIGSLETEPLRRMGITSRSRSVKRPGGDVETRFKMSYRDKDQIQREIRSVGIDQARIAALTIMEAKYGQAADRMAKTWVGVWSTFVGSVKMAAARIGDALRANLLPVLDRLNQWIARGLDTGVFERWGHAIFGWVGNFIRYVRAMIGGWNSLSTATRDQLKNMGMAAGVFIIAWKVEFVQVMIRSLAYLVVSSKWAFTAVAGGFSALAGFIVGYKIGVALEKGFSLSTFMLKWAVTLKDMGATLRNNFTLWTDLAQIAGRGLWKALKGDESGARAAMAEVGARWQSWMDRMNPLKMKTRLDARFAEIDALNRAMGEGPERDLKTRFAAFTAELKRQFATAEGWLETAAMFLPEPLKKALRELMEKFKSNLGPLPNIRLSTGSAGLAKDMQEAAEAAGKMAKILEPLRGFSTGQYGSGGGRHRGPSPGRGLPGDVSEDPRWKKVGWRRSNVTMARMERDARAGRPEMQSVLPLPRGGDINPPSANPPAQPVAPAPRAWNGQIEDRQGRYAAAAVAAARKVLGRAEPGTLLGGADAEIANMPPKIRAMIQQWQRQEKNPPLLGFGQAVPLPFGFNLQDELRRERERQFLAQNGPWSLYDEARAGTRRYRPGADVAMPGYVAKPEPAAPPAPGMQAFTAMTRQWEQQRANRAHGMAGMLIEAFRGLATGFGQAVPTPRGFSAIQPDSAAGPLLRDREERDRAKAQRDRSDGLGAMVDRQTETNKILGRILQTKAAFSFA